MRKSSQLWLFWALALVSIAERGGVSPPVVRAVIAESKNRGANAVPLRSQWNELTLRTPKEWL